MTVVQSFWLGPRLPALQVLGLRSFVAHGHDVHLYTFEPIENVPDGVRVLDAASVLPADHVFTYQSGFGRGSPSAFSNIFRYKLLLERGGWWVDTDVVCLRPFTFDREYVFASERGVDGQISAASCVIKSPPGTPWLRYCLDVAESRDRSTLQWGDIGPRLVGEAIARFQLDGFMEPPSVFNPIDYSEFAEIQAPAFDFARLENAFGVHLWNQKWTSHCLDPDFDGASDSLYSALRARYLLAADRLYANDRIAEEHRLFLQRCIEDLRSQRDEALWRTEGVEREVASLQHELHGMQQRSQEQVAQQQRVEAKLHQTEADARATAEQLLRATEQLRTASAQLRETESRLTQSEAQVLHGRLELAAIQRSRSWRMTRPFRAIFDALFASGKGPPDDGGA